MGRDSFPGIHPRGSAPSEGELGRQTHHSQCPPFILVSVLTWSGTSPGSVGAVCPSRVPPKLPEHPQPGPWGCQQEQERPWHGSKAAQTQQNIFVLSTLPSAQTQTRPQAGLCTEINPARPRGSTSPHPAGPGVTPGDPRGSLPVLGCCSLPRPHRGFVAQSRS